VLLILLASGVQAQAPENAPLATFAVNSTIDAVDATPGNGVCATAGDVCTLRAAIQEANALAGDDSIILPAGTYTLTIAGAGEDAAATGDLDLTSNITLTGAGAGSTSINGSWMDRILHVTGAYTVNISGVTLTHGNGSGGGIRNDGGVLTITDSAISDNNSGANAGGILNTGTLAINNSTIFDNNAWTDAGGISSAGTLTITNSTFSYNNAGSKGGGIFNSGKITVTASTFSNNNSGTDGGAIFSSSTLAISTSTFSANNAANGGGIYAGGVSTITHSTFSANSASSGGGIFTQSSVTIANSTFSNNDASHGDDSYTNGGSLVIINSTLFGAVSDPDRIAGSGGGVYNVAGGGGSVTLFNTIVAGHASGGNCVGVITNGGYNLDDDATCGWGSVNGSMSNADPALGALTGSPAYFPLNLNSPAIDAGDNAACAAAPVNNTAQNGVTRPIDGDSNGTATCDIGAFEAAAGFRLYLPAIMK